MGAGRCRCGHPLRSRGSARRPGATAAAAEPGAAVSAGAWFSTAAPDAGRAERPLAGPQPQRPFRPLPAGSQTGGLPPGPRASLGWTCSGARAQVPPPSGRSCLSVRCRCRLPPVSSRSVSSPPVSSPLASNPPVSSPSSRRPVPQLGPVLRPFRRHRRRRPHRPDRWFLPLRSRLRATSNDAFRLRSAAGNAPFVALAAWAGTVPMPGETPLGGARLPMTGPQPGMAAPGGADAMLPPGTTGGAAAMPRTGGAGPQTPFSPAGSGAMLPQSTLSHSTGGEPGRSCCRRRKAAMCGCASRRRLWVRGRCARIADAIHRREGKMAVQEQSHHLDVRLAASWCHHPHPHDFGPDPEVTIPRSPHAQAPLDRDTDEPAKSLGRAVRRSLVVLAVLVPVRTFGTRCPQVSSEPPPWGIGGGSLLLRLERLSSRHMLTRRSSRRRPTCVSIALSADWAKPNVRFPAKTRPSGVPAGRSR